MKKYFAEFLTYYDKEIVKEMMKKYNYKELDAFKEFINSKTYAMLSDIELEMWDYGPLGIFEMWENEKITGTPLTSVDLRSEVE